jgi:peroxiredoxin
MPCRFTAALSAILVAIPSILQASPAEAEQARKGWERKSAEWNAKLTSAVSPEERQRIVGERPDPSPSLRGAWSAISRSLDQEWTLDSAAWFLRNATGVLTRNADGTTSPQFATEMDSLLKAVEQHHLTSPRLMPLCMALAGSQDPRALPLLEKILARNPDKKVRGVAALAIAMALRTLGDEPPIMRRRLEHLRTAIIESSDIELDGSSVAAIAEDELHIIRYLSKGRTAPDLSGADSGARPRKLSDHKGKVIMLLFWSDAMWEAARTREIMMETARRFAGRPFMIVGVNHDPVEKLRAFEANDAFPREQWVNFSDPQAKLAAEFRVANWPAVFVLDGNRTIHYAGGPGSFADLTAEALLTESSVKDPR